MSRKQRSLKERFEEKFTKGPDDVCWEWMAGTNSKGYGVIGKGRRVDGLDYAHRVSYMTYVGDIPDGHDVCHSCDNPKCVNPKHLFVGTRKDNMQDCVSKGRTNKPIGESHPKALLTEKDVLRIRASNETNKALAKKYQMSVSGIRSARVGISWKHIGGSANV